MSPRLRAVAAAIPASAGAVADVGAGDGQLARHLSARGRRVVATERLPGPFVRLQATSPGLDCRLGDGLSVLRPAEVDCVVLAGMGGRTIARLLRASMRSSPALVAALRCLVLQPQQRAGDLVAWLGTAGFRTLASAETSERGRSYAVLVVQPPR
ncbi:MAG: class I SAM-dependent methyltransferase [Candidatus Dormibacteraeota bacterium]|jgi:tRNA (adenine22-N1)-methyltransferase|nr:class I SAM-dependent methyltransferase [Candidatus Dormibacteraeota bacterium]MDQ6921140.1 class I SAM-dependent methyltransferase [Candidatus Dormibacteraeota bacterium]